jgi:hypothetical protein
LRVARSFAATTFHRQCQRNRHHQNGLPASPGELADHLSSSADDRHHVRLVSFDETSTTERMQHGSEDLRQNHVVIALILARVGRTRITFVPAIGG